MDKPLTHNVSISVVSPNNIPIGTIGSFVKHSEDNEVIIYECSRFCFSNFSIAEYFRDKKKFSIVVKTTVLDGKRNLVEQVEQRQDDCFIIDHSFCHTPSVANTAKIKAFKHPTYNVQDVEEYERWLESTFVW